MRFSRLRIWCWLGVIGVLGTCAFLTPQPSRAGILDALRERSSGTRQSKQTSARAALSQATSLNARADSAQARLRGAQKTLLLANAYYFNYRRQIKRTESQMVRARHRRYLVTERYNRRRILFGRRLAAMQRTGKAGYLQIFLGSKTLSDLTRRYYLFRALITRDSELQEGLRADKAMLESLNSMLSRQWKQRNTLQKQTNQERVRIAQAAQSQQRDLSRIVHSRNELLAYATTQVQSIKETDREIAEYNARQQAQAAQAEAEEEAQREYQRHIERSNRRVSRVARANSDDDSYRSSRRSSYGRTRSYRRSRWGRSRRNYYTASYRAPRSYRVREARRIDRVRYVPMPGGGLKPMSISEIVFKDKVVAVGSGASKSPPPQSGSAGGRSSDSGSSNLPPPADDFPASDP